MQTCPKAHEAVAGFPATRTKREAMASGANASAAAQVADPRRAADCTAGQATLEVRGPATQRLMAAMGWMRDPSGASVNG